MKEVISFKRLVNSHLVKLVLAILTVMALFVHPDTTRFIEYPTYGMLYAILCILFWGFYEKTGNLRVKKTDFILFKAVSVFFGLLNTAGIYMYYRTGFPDSVFGWSVFAVRTIVYSLLFYDSVNLFLYLYDKYVSVMDLELSRKICSIRTFLENRIHGKGIITFIERHKCLSVSAFIFLCWLPWIVTYYPASIETDTYYPIEQYLGMIEKTNHHPWTYVFVVGFFYKFGLSLGDKNIGMFLYILLRDIICALIYGAVVVKLYKANVKRVICFSVMLFYAITPVFGAYAKHAFKNTFAAALFTLFVLMVFEALDRLENKTISWKNMVKVGGSAFVFSAFLNNGIYVTFPVVVMLGIALFIKRYVKLSLLLFTVMMSFFVYHMAGMKYFGIKPTSKAEALAIPMQQVTRTVKYNMDNLSEDDKEFLKYYGDLQEIADAYDPLISDPIKAIWGKGGDGPRFIKLWGRLGVKYPMTYIEAFIAHSYGYYAFTPREAEHAGAWNSGMTYFHWVKDSRYSDEFTCDYIDGFEGGRTVLEKWADLWDVTPLLSLTDTMPLYTWCIVLFGVFAIRKRRFILLIPIMGGILMILTCMASPVNGCFRYFSAVAAAFPAYLTVACDHTERCRFVQT